MTAAFTFSKDLNVEEIGRRGYASIKCKVLGYWSSDCITLYVTRNSFTKEKGWEVTLSHSSGGRDNKEVVDDLDAEANFGAALIAMAAFGKEVRARAAEFEAFYQMELQRIREEQEILQAAKQAKWEADAPLGYLKAEEMVEKIKRDGAMVTVYRRGEDSSAGSIYCNRYYKTVFYFNNTRTKKADVVDILATSSARTCIEN